MASAKSGIRRLVSAGLEQTAAGSGASGVPVGPAVAQAAPHVRDAFSLSHAMRCVQLALLPCLFMALYNSGYQANIAVAIAQTDSAPGWRGTLLDALGIEKTYLCGLSMGGNVALHMGINHPHRVEAVISACTGSGSSQEDGFIDQFKIYTDILDKGEIERFADMHMSGPSYTRLVELRPDLKDSKRKALMENNAVGLANTIRGVQMKRPPIMSLEDKLKKLEVPVLVIVGDEDMPCIEPADFMHQHIPRARLVVLPRTGHILNMERPADFNREVMDFLNSVESGQI